MNSPSNDPKSSASSKATGGGQPAAQHDQIPHDLVAHLPSHAMQNEDWLAQIFMNSTDAIVIEDLSGTVMALNRAAGEAYGYQPAELIGTPISKLWPDEASSAALQLREDCLQGKPIRNVEVKRITKTGSVVSSLLNVVLLTSASGTPNAIASIAKDISRRKKAELSLRTELQRRDEFLATLSHELRNPLGAALNATRVVGRSLDKPEALTSSVEIIVNQLSQVSRLLDDLLDISRIANNKIELRKSVVDLRDIARHSLITVGDQFERRRHVVDVDLPKRAVKIEGDSARMLQVVENLLCNAAKYTPAGGSIKLRVAKTATHAQLSVSDNGRGLSPAMLATIFEPFSQGDHADETGNGGMGVGLSLVKSLVELHGGTIEVTSKGKDMGSEFQVSVPLTKRKLPRKKEAERMAPTEQRQIALVEDNQHSRQSLKMLLRLDGFEVTDAANAAGGFELITQSLPGIAILDIGLPDMTGYELAIKIREKLGERTPYLIALTGYGRESDRKAVFEAGFDAHLVKPLDIEKLYATIKQIGSSDAKRKK